MLPVSYVNRIEFYYVGSLSRGNSNLPRHIACFGNYWKDRIDIDSLPIGPCHSS